MADPPQMLSLGFNAVSSTGSAGRGMPILTGFLLMGPRQASERSSKTGCKGLACLAAKPVMRAELALRQMLAVDHSVSVHALLKKSEQISDLLPVMGYLLFYDWIGTSHDTLHVWLAGDSRTMPQRAPNQVVAKFN